MMGTTQLSLFTNAGNPTYAARGTRPAPKRPHRPCRTSEVRRILVAEMADTHQRTLAELRDLVGGNISETGLSARIRELRKREYGGYDIRSTNLGSAQNPRWVYWMER